MKMVFQSILCLGLVMSGLMWVLSQAKRELYEDPPQFVIDLINEEDRDFTSEWSYWTRHNYWVQQTTHADEVFWVLLCTLIMTWKVS